eukprot:6204135-Pleurochrysis_carterae.AAC.1
MAHIADEAIQYKKVDDPQLFAYSNSNCAQQASASSMAAPRCLTARSDSTAYRCPRLSQNGGRLAQGSRSH